MATLSEQKIEKGKEGIRKEGERKRKEEITIRETQGKNERGSTVAWCIETWRLHRAHRVSRI